jgi:hypothetical protein
MAGAGLAALHATLRHATRAGDAQRAASILAPLFADTGWLEGIVADACAQMSRNPLALPPFSATHNGALSHLVLAASPAVMVALSRIGGAVERTGGEAPPPRVCFSGQQSLWRLLSAEPLAGRLARQTGPDKPCRDRAMTLQPARTLMLDERRLSLWLAPPTRPAWLLRARIRRDPAPEMRSVTLGAHPAMARVQGDDAFARAVMLLSLVRALDARRGFDAGLDLLARASGTDRWTVMRELVAIDPVRALPHLEEMAADDREAPPVRRAAEGVIAQLACAMGEPALCPA